MASESAPPRILVVDDDPKVRLLLRRCFEPEGYLVEEAGTGGEMNALLGQLSFDLITLDLNLGAEDGLTLARDVRTVSDVPIVMVTGKGDVIDKVVGLELGADDYIAKPFHVREVLARIRSVLRRSDRRPSDPADHGGLVADQGPKPQDGGRCFRFDRWIVDFDRLNLTDADGNPCTLTSGEFSLLEVFVSNPGRVLTRDSLMDNLKGEDWSANDRAIDNQIARLRKKIETDPTDPRLIKTMRGAGYIFAGEVTASQK